MNSGNGIVLFSSTRFQKMFSLPVFFLEFLQSSSPQRQYHLITKQKSWPSAQAYCREHYADLATVENEVDRNNIQREAQRLGLMSEAWVGLYNDIDSWRCSRKDIPLKWTRWGRDEPNNQFGEEECVTAGSGQTTPVLHPSSGLHMSLITLWAMRTVVV
uniref:C-type lectin domain-containing protein n=1 Tax=Astyanax mexicanus TaxID=7994 RepID=W5LQP1_ASTMX